MRSVVTETGYRYIRTEPEGKNFDLSFKPELTPKQMLQLGVFCGAYYKKIPKEFPRTWFEHALLSKTGEPDCALNFFKVRSGQSYAVWKKKGWIHPDDPHGWFEWYCRYYNGRRHEDDARQIRRWRAFRRHAAQIAKHCLPGDMVCRRVQRQALLHWAYDSRKI